MNKQIFLTNNFSINMFSESTEFTSVDFQRLSRPEAVELTKGVEIISAIGHQDTAQVLTDALGVSVEFNRHSVELDTQLRNWVLVVCQLTGGRLPEGSTTLPEGFNFNYWLVFPSS